MAGSPEAPIAPASTIGFYAYIDESGDEGFKFDGCSRSWFVLSAAVNRAEDDHQMGRIVSETKRCLGRNRRHPLHFCDLTHEQRLPFVDRIAKSTITTMSVLVHKPSLDKSRFSGKDVEKHQLYRYASRLLLERVSWYCRDNRKTTSEKVSVIFSNRAQMSYEALREYLQTLRDMGKPWGVKIDWNVLQPDAVSARNHDQMHGLEIADAVSGSIWHAIHETKYGFREPRYAQMLKRTMYRRCGNLESYGLKIIPTDEATKAKIEPEIRPLIELMKE